MLGAIDCLRLDTQPAVSAVSWGDTQHEHARVERAGNVLLFLLQRPQKHAYRAYRILHQIAELVMRHTSSKPLGGLKDTDLAAAGAPQLPVHVSASQLLREGSVCTTVSTCSVRRARTLRSARWARAVQCVLVSFGVFTLCEGAATMARALARLQALLVWSAVCVAPLLRPAHVSAQSADYDDDIGDALPFSEEDVLVLTDANFTSVVESSQFILVSFTHG